MMRIRLFPIAVYLGIGMALHALFLSPVIDWQSAWTYAYLLGWPALVVYWIGSWVMWVIAAGLAIGFGIVIWEYRK
jgi:uncharacterized membrane protein YraQ (UPF0718 family)